MTFYYRGRVAMAAILRALGVGAGDRVAIQAFTCLAVPEGIAAIGASPRYIDIERGGFNMDPDNLRSRLDKSIKAIVVQHTFGMPAQLKKISDMAADHAIPLVEDCSHLIPGFVDPLNLGRVGVAAFYSFEWGKPIVAGIGGAALANRADLAATLSQQSESYLEPPSTRTARIGLQYVAHRILYRPALFWPVRGLYHRLGKSGIAEQNYHALANSPSEEFQWKMAQRLRRRAERKLMFSDRVSQRSKEIARHYHQRISNSAVKHPEVEPDQVTFCRYPLRVSAKLDVLTAARKANTELADWYSSPIHPLTRAEWSKVGYRTGECPEAERRCDEVVTLPTHSAVSDRDVEKAVRFFNRLER